MFFKIFEVCKCMMPKMLSRSLSLVLGTCDSNVKGYIHNTSLAHLLLIGYVQCSIMIRLHYKIINNVNNTQKCVKRLCLILLKVHL